MSAEFPGWGGGGMTFFSSKSISCDTLVPQMYFSRTMRKSALCLCKHLRHRSACASTHTGQHLCYSLPRYTDTSNFCIRIFNVGNPKEKLAHSGGESRVSFYYCVFYAFVFKIPPTTR